MFNDDGALDRGKAELSDYSLQKVLENPFVHCKSDLYSVAGRTTNRRPIRKKSSR